MLLRGSTAGLDDMFGAHLTRQPADAASDRRPPAAVRYPDGQVGGSRPLHAAARVHAGDRPGLRRDRISVGVHLPPAAVRSHRRLADSFEFRRHPQPCAATLCLNSSKDRSMPARPSVGAARFSGTESSRQCLRNLALSAGLTAAASCHACPRTSSRGRRDGRRRRTDRHHLRARRLREGSQLGGGGLRVHQPRRLERCAARRFPATRTASTRSSRRLAALFLTGSPTTLR